MWAVLTSGCVTLTVCLRLPCLQFTPTHEGTASVHVLLDGTHVRGSPMPVSVHRDVDALARGALTGKLSTAVTGLRRGLTTARRMQNQLRSEAEGLQQYVPVLVQVPPPLVPRACLSGV